MSAPDAGTTVLTPTIGAQARKSLFWIAAAVFALAIALTALALAGSSAGGTPLAADNAAPAGAKALVSVLRDQGVDVVATGTLRATAAVIDDPARTTLAIYDPDGILDSLHWDSAASLADTVVLIDPGFAALESLAPDIANAGVVSGGVESACELPFAVNAPQITGDGAGYRTVPDAASVELCYPSEDDVYSLASIRGETGTVIAIGATDALSNEFIADRSNAALALTLFGQSDRLIWYLPSIDDLSAGEPTTDELTPPWAVPAIALLALAALAAALWKGRRFGPLVVENLPVTVRSSETMEGRARLYESSAARARAIDALRIATLERIAAECGLPRVATVDEVAIAASSVTRAPLDVIRRVLVDDQPQNDRQLLSLSDELERLEIAVRTATSPD